MFFKCIKECRNHNYMYCGSCFNWNFWGFMRYRADNNSSAERKKIHQSIEWYDNNVSKLDEAYAKADYNTVSELVDGYKGNSSVIQKWNHYSFITLYGSYYRRVNDIYNKMIC